MNFRNQINLKSCEYNIILILKKVWLSPDISRPNSIEISTGVRMNEAKIKSYVITLLLLVTLSAVNPVINHE